jgi:2C-methyl-D-erythritol 2,4-cyclodiphosphate synthase
MNLERGISKVTPAIKLDILTDLAVSTMNQQQIADKYELDKSRISRIKQDNAQQIDDIRSTYTTQYTGELVRNQQWRLAEREKDMDILKDKRSPEFVLARETIRKNIAEELGQIAPKVNVVIVPVEHKYSFDPDIV